MRLLKRIVLGVIGAILAVYLVFAIGLTVLEWVVRENPSVEQSLLAHSTAPHTITHFDQGAASFQRRLELIASARTSIALEFFIYDVDDASRLLTQALIKRAREGVQVRILVDFSAPVFQLKPAYARLLGEAGVKVRYYNTSAIYRLVSIQHRSHRKLLIIDEADRADRRPQYRQRLLRPLGSLQLPRLRPRGLRADREDGAPEFRRLLEFPPRHRARARF